MPRSFVDQDFVLSILAVYGATVAFNRWFPNLDLIAVDAHPKSYLPTFEASTESALYWYGAYLVVDIIRVITAAILQSASFSFAFVDAKFDIISWAPFAFSMFSITKDILMLGLLYTFPEANEVAAEKIADLMPTAVTVELGWNIVSAITFAAGLYQWTYAIGRDKRQVIKEAKKNN
ncbi:hypothetical protein BGX29_008586 [Mortierella sp. GBA35]|nr:hypothetical protein BGX23_008259 [Mortierella sp. AD031]KAF9096371.1 hypothetical protein BGX29_008586 [Mortierella sp. GBA35]KAG0204358.1 hypothetical protein BGX33_008561 [Mortierella sp. NVP41]